MKHDHPYLPESFFLLRFISGLKDTIKHDTQCHQPATLRNAYWFARKQELSYMCNNKKTPASAKPVTNFPPTEIVQQGTTGQNPYRKNQEREANVGTAQRTGTMATNAMRSKIYSMLFSYRDILMKK
jgi:hypothetical protein